MGPIFPTCGSGFDPYAKGGMAHPRLDLHRLPFRSIQPRSPIYASLAVATFVQVFCRSLSDVTCKAPSNRS